MCGMDAGDLEAKLDYQQASCKAAVNSWIDAIPKDYSAAPKEACQDTLVARFLISGQVSRAIAPKIRRAMRS